MLRFCGKKIREVLGWGILGAMLVLPGFSWAQTEQQLENMNCEESYRSGVLELRSQEECQALARIFTGLRLGEFSFDAEEQEFSDPERFSTGRISDWRRL